jgi:hypothetical protein
VSKAGFIVWKLPEELDNRNALFCFHG